VIDLWGQYQQSISAKQKCGGTSGLPGPKKLKRPNGNPVAHGVWCKRYYSVYSKTAPNFISTIYKKLLPTFNFASLVGNRL